MEAYKCHSRIFNIFPSRFKYKLHNPSYGLQTLTDENLCTTTLSPFTWPFEHAKHFSGFRHLQNATLFSFLFFSFFERERECEWGRGRDWETGSKGGSALTGWQQRARCRTWTHRLWDHDLSRSLTLNRLSHPGAPECYFFLTHDSSHSFTYATAFVECSLCIRCDSSWLRYAGRKALEWEITHLI